MADAAFDPLVRAVVRGLRQRCGVRDGGRVLVAVSGGADSVALLRAMHHLSRRRTWRLTLVVGHVDHGLRDDSAADAAFVADLARTLTLPHLCRAIDLARDAPNLEAAARRLRYAALGEMAREAGAAFVATAHHGDDMLETQLMALLRGPTIRGLRGIAWRRPLTAGVTLVRPMLGATHALATDYLRAIGQSWREDHTNADVTRTRARLRRDVLPVLRELRPGVARQAVKLADEAREALRRMEKER